LKKLASFILAIILLFTGCRLAVGSETNKIILKLPAFELKYYEGETLVTTYPVAIGRKTSQTPVGDFKVINKLTFPTWFPRGRDSIPPGPANPLGTRWLVMTKKE
jgi:L,D-transpeptidase ErfK/SrfK